MGPKLAWTPVVQTGHTPLFKRNVARRLSRLATCETRVRCTDLRGLLARLLGLALSPCFAALLSGPLYESCTCAIIDASEPIVPFCLSGSVFARGFALLLMQYLVPLVGPFRRVPPC